MKHLNISFILLFLCQFSNGQVPAIQWQKALGGSDIEYGQTIKQTADGGYILAGHSTSNNGDVEFNHGGFDYWVVKLDATGSVVWKKSFGSYGDDLAYSVQQTTDGGYILAGYSKSFDIPGYHGLLDYWILKLDGAGNMLWQKSLGGSGDDMAFSIQQTIDGGYIVAGSSDSNNGDVSGNHGNTDYWVVKLDGTGSIQWQKALGGSGAEVGMIVNIRQTPEGGYILGGTTSSTNGDVTGIGGYWIVKLSTSGNIEWQKTLGGTGFQQAYDIQLTKDGGYVMAGTSSSNDGDVSGNHNFSSDFWVVKVNGSGTIQWQKSLGGSNSDVASSIKETTDGGFIVGGISMSSDGDVSANLGGYDYWIVKLNDSGNVQWQKNYGGSGYDFLHEIGQTSDGGYIITGHASSNDGDVSGNHGSSDGWIIKLAPDVILSVPLLSFTAEEQADAIVTSWKINYDKTVNHFNVQRSTDGIRFDNVSKVFASSANSATAQIYNYYDRSIYPSGTKLYYRLQTVDKDASKSYSKVVSITTSSHASFITIYPNPASKLLYVQGENIQSISIKDVAGKLVKKIASKGTYKTIIPLTSLPKGLYFITVKNNMGNIKTDKLVID